MLMFLLFGVLCMLERTEGQNCTFPCNLINKNFTWRNRDNVGFWNFRETTFVTDVVSGFPTNYECFKIVGRFLILRDQSRFSCWVIEINNADHFTGFFPRATHVDFKDECNVCSQPYNYLFKLSAVDTVAQNQTAPECNIPVGCTTGSSVCVDNGSIEGECNEATTPPPPPPTTPPPPPPPKRCKHKHQ